MSDPIVDIAVGAAVHKTFHYLVPEELRPVIVPGARVLVPFGRRQATGTVVGFARESGSTALKSIISVVHPFLPAPLLDLARWMADYYLHPIGLTIETIIPRAIDKAGPKKIRYLRLLAGRDTLALKGKKQEQLVRLLSDQGEVSMGELSSFSRSTIRALIEAGIIEVVEKVSSPEAVIRGDGEREVPPGLMPAQTEAVRSITRACESGSFGVFLLHGVTGSGKTEVYLRSIAQLAGRGTGSIVLVPEIALTPQLLGRFRRRFGNRVAVLHSGLTDRERADEYRRILEGRVDVAIGARSAVFAPFSKLGLVIVDEEHEQSYKQEEGLRYHARDVAVMRAKIQGAVAVLGSATPALESFHNARTGKYEYLRLPERVDHRPLPPVTIVDMKGAGPHSVFSAALAAALGKRLQERQQALLLLNRRGFSPVLVCGECGAVVKCPSCSVSLTFHKAARPARLKCHYCDHTEPPPDQCPACAGAALKPLGAGTQKIEEDLGQLFPGARTVRMDRDSVRGREAYEAMLGKIEDQQADILLGTQMVAKGHDFPGVTLVGVVNADVGLGLPDFRSAEKTFQLVTQAAGRAGRGAAGGEVIIQTMNPGHYAMIFSRTHDYEGFFDDEIAFRKELGYPPFRRAVKLEVQSAREVAAFDAARAALNRIRSLTRAGESTVLGPAPSPVARVRGRYRFQILLLSERRDVLRRLATAGRDAAEEKGGRSCRVIVDVDPMNLM